MQKRFLPALFVAAFFLIITHFGCTKIDTTTLGSDLVSVDNVNTFADTLAVLATQGIINDSTLVLKADNQVIGNITNDALFGTTNAAIYAQFKPTFYPFYFGNAGDKVYPSQSPMAGFDSAFVCLSFKGTWGDSSSSAPQTFEVRQINDDRFRINTDTLRKLDFTPPMVNATLLGSAMITPAIARQKVKLARGRDSVDNQIRIKLTGAGQSFASLLYNSLDSTTVGPNNGFYRDSIFRKILHGFEIKVSGPGRTLYYVNLAEAKSRFEFHYHKVTAAGVADTAIQSFQFYTAAISNAISASSGTDYVKRNYTGTPLQAALTSPAPSDVFLQTSPGTFANIKIPGLTGYPNRIVHRAYLIIEQTPDNPTTDGIYTPPPFLYADLKDTVISSPQRYKPVYFDLSTQVAYNPDATGANLLYHPFPLTNVDIANFGGRLLQRYEGSNTPFARYEINITRYVQHIVSNGFYNYDLRLYAPYSYYYPQYVGAQYVIPYYNPLAFGRVRVGSGNNPNHKMRLVVVYSKV
ncbi:MAG: DUF4270 family protein [Ferruginibacter sp.]